MISWCVCKLKIAKYFNLLYLTFNSLVHICLQYSYIVSFDMINKEDLLKNACKVEISRTELSYCTQKRNIYK